MAVMASQKAVCIVRNEPLLNKEFIIKPNTIMDNFRKSLAENLEQTSEEFSCPFLPITEDPAPQKSVVTIDLTEIDALHILKKKKTTGYNPGKVVDDLPPAKSLRSSRRHSAKKLPHNIYTGLINSGNTCYLNSFLQVLFMTPELRNAVIRWDLQNSTDNFLIHLQKLFIILKTTTLCSISTREFNMAFTWMQRHLHDQQDVQELFGAFYDQLEESSKSLDTTNIVEKLYGGSMRYYIVCGKCNMEKSHVSGFKDIVASIKNINTDEPYETLHDVLMGFVTPEKLTGSNQYQCERCVEKTDSLKGLEIVRCPKILNITLLRTHYDVKTGRCLKINSKLDFPNILNLTGIVPQAGGVHYELYGVIIHSGNPTFGHYKANIKDLKTGQWTTFDDDAITLIKDTDLTKAFGGYGSTSAYMLTYRRLDVDNEKFDEPGDFPLHTKNLVNEYVADHEESYRDLLVIHHKGHKNFFVRSNITIKELFSYLCQELDYDMTRARILGFDTRIKLYVNCLFYWYGTIRSLMKKKHICHLYIGPTDGDEFVPESALSCLSDSQKLRTLHYTSNISYPINDFLKLLTNCLIRCDSKFRVLSENYFLTQKEVNKKESELVELFPMIGDKIFSGGTLRALVQLFYILTETRQKHVEIQFELRECTVLLTLK